MSKDIIIGGEVASACKKNKGGVGGGLYPEKAISTEGGIFKVLFKGITNGGGLLNLSDSVGVIGGGDIAKPQKKKDIWIGGDTARSQLKGVTAIGGVIARICLKILHKLNGAEEESPELVYAIGGGGVGIA
jgi:hypothetical protein